MPLIGKKVGVVFKKKKKVKPGKHAPSSLPSFTKSGSTSSGRRTSSLTSDQNCGTKEDDLFGDDELLASVDCDTMLAVENLTSNVETCVTIPLSANQPDIRGVVACQLNMLQDANIGDTVVSSEIRSLLHGNRLRQLSSQKGHFSLLVQSTDYERGVWDAFCQREGSTEPVAKWFLERLSEWTGQRISASQVQASWETRPLAGSSLEQVLQELQSCGVLLATHSSAWYQLWLPSWGKVLRAWEDARKKLLLQLKKSSYKERSQKAIQQKHSPIPTSVLVQWLVEQDEVVLVSRAAGAFVRLSSSIA